MKTQIQFGALAPPLAEQLGAAGVKIAAADLDHYQRDTDAITRLRIRGLITDAMATRAFRHLLKDISHSVRMHDIAYGHPRKGVAEE